MARLIDVDELKKSIIKKLGIASEKYLLESEKAIFEETDKAPTVDAVPVIRCEECKYFCAEQVEYDTPYGFTNFNYVCWCDKHTDYENQKYLEVHTDDYCSWAEREEE